MKRFIRHFGATALAFGLITLPRTFDLIDLFWWLRK